MKFHWAIMFAAFACARAALSADEELQEVTISATAFRTTVEDTIQPVVVLAGDELQRSLTGSIGESIARLPGVTGTYFGPQASRPVIRGFSGERVQVLEDGIGALDVSALSEDHAVSVEDLLAEQVEVIKGPATLLYGSGAIGGVVNIVTQRVPELRGGDAGLHGAAELHGDSATGERAAAAKLNLVGATAALHVDGYDRRTADFDIPGRAWTDRLRQQVSAADPTAVEPDGRMPNSDSRTRGGSMGGTAGGDRGSVGVAVSRFETNYGVPPAPGEPMDQGGVRIDMRQTRYELRARLDAAPESVWQGIELRGAWNDYRHAELESDGAIGTQFLQKGSELRASTGHVAGPLSGTLGMQWRRIDFEALGTETFVPPSLTDSAGLFAFERYDAGRVIFETGVRIDRQTTTPAGDTALPPYSGNAFSASAGALWKMRGSLSLAANLTRSQRHPTAAELYADGAHEATAQFIRGDTGLGKEAATTFDLVLRGGEAANGWQLSGWTSEFSNYIYLQPSGDTEDGLPVFDYRQSGARLFGAEFEWRRMLLQRGSRSLQLQLQADAVRGQLDGDSNLPQMPPFRAGAGLNGQSGQWQADLHAFRYSAQRRVADYESSTDGYWLIDAEVSSTPAIAAGRLQVFVKLDNLTDATGRRHTSPLKDYVPLPARSLGAGLRWEF